MISPEELGKEIEDLVREHGGQLKGYLIHKRGLPEHGADEVLNKALLAVAVTRQRGEALDDPRAFLYESARNAAVDWIAATCRAPIPDSSVAGEMQGPDMLEAFEVSEDTARALQQLPPRQRMVLTLRYFYGYSVEETGRIMGISPGTVGATTTAARRNLKKIIKEQNGSGEEETP